ncbi:hypothetical protein K435DRAFT_794662 [Dendrothele bispora CBS 962.96]|uniref:Uncharacterized protein n=1 Tax=Dendrothele bispora (strain CBS 962.96) TaxID=1314807 RepID=A0A4S8MBI1_DENBC|nr:hypothetical protein K435DRAFT_794662 [Dendrothele bispora CBS 962.96]
MTLEKNLLALLYSHLSMPQFDPQLKNPTTTRQTPLKICRKRNLAGAKKKRKHTTNLVELMRNKKKRGKSGPKNKLDHFKRAAKLLSKTESPYINYCGVLMAGLERDGKLPEELEDPEVDDDLDRVRNLKIYDKLVTHIPNFDVDIEEILEADALDELVSIMNTSASTAISGDVRILKTRILSYALEILGIESFTPPIDGDLSKSVVRGWNHSQLSMLLCTPIKLDECQKDPDTFRLRVLEGDINIDSSHIPVFMYDDLGDATSNGHEYVESGIFLGQLLFLIECQVWVTVFLGPETASAYRTNPPGTRFNIKKVGPAHSYKLKEVTPRMIAYAGVLASHSLSASTDWHTDDGAVVKEMFFDSIVAMFEDPDIRDEEVVRNVLNQWTEQVGWMLPGNEKSKTQDIKDDPDSTLAQLKRLRRKERLHEDSMAKSSASAHASPGPSTISATANNGSESIPVPINDSNSIPLLANKNSDNDSQPLPAPTPRSPESDTVQSTAIDLPLSVSKSPLATLPAPPSPDVHKSSSSTDKSKPRVSKKERVPTWADKPSTSVSNTSASNQDPSIEVRLRTDTSADDRYLYRPVLDFPKSKPVSVRFCGPDNRYPQYPTGRLPEKCGYLEVECKFSFKY